MYWRQSRRLGVLIAAAVLSLGMLAPNLAIAADGATNATLRADLDGVQMKLVEVGDHFCNDFDYPVIHCYSSAKALEARVNIASAASSGLYLTAYDYTGFQGSYMYFSQNYTCLACIGWDDRISSFIVRNSQSGNFYTDWFYGGTVYGWCCNQALTGLGSYNNTFSSVYRF